MEGTKILYNSKVKAQMKKDFAIKNDFAIPRILKVVINVGVGEAVSNKKAIEKVKEQVELIAGQAAVVTKAKKSIAAYKIRIGLAIGVKVTLRGKRMYYFLDKLIQVILPRKRDFRGISETSVDQHGNLNIGFTEQTIFPEIEYDKIDKLRGLEVTVVTSMKDHEKGKKLFELLGIPFQKETE
ncbi:50S ribosomal protein L5 [Candidatus Roizmanbacteria bacterium CG_4_9_14_0_2_um_filter_39_13]|uniref:Large ribosomal subunit protein uL5 n=2 Tax=Candidatus Roizmaniibacteriota TaxID=1752723 RepID=A0A2M8EXJ1_9BACT|nr:MAG: 50S ribosomal protein L5 [Candidatus Roizmanbacteria bacterium CG_4_10_14_0_2_um_filter_39_12]PJC30757.1 MAG: 50S ribosomal protein L5 [Candidatus Roizmanbacteria bacterium CG_4_9_14_0_2_um_filter_39_13]PJE62276.1 MAG: 50S ribosomal protein L5 [Candidatus Roizmanbacteria bacterium CG10_big_fil_rev_8_21_14_0_10_39_12]